MQIYLNTNTRNSFMYGFSHGDRMVTSDDLLTFEFDKCDDTVAADKAFKIGNLRLADRNGKQYLPQIRSISVGDVIDVDGIFYAVADFGFRTVVPSLVKRTTTRASRRWQTSTSRRRGSPTPSASSGRTPTISLD